MTTQTPESTLDSPTTSVEAESVPVEVDPPLVEVDAPLVQVDPLPGVVDLPLQIHPLPVASGPITVTLPSEVHSSAHEVRYEGSLIGQYEVRIFVGSEGPVIVLEEGSSSPLPLEYLSEYAITRFIGALPISRARFFERYIRGATEHWVEGIKSDGQFRRDVCGAQVVKGALAAPDNPYWLRPAASPSPEDA